MRHNYFVINNYIIDILLGFFLESEGILFNCCWVLISTSIPPLAMWPTWAVTGITILLIPARSIATSTTRRRTRTRTLVRGCLPRLGYTYRILNKWSGDFSGAYFYIYKNIIFNMSRIVFLTSNEWGKISSLLQGLVGLERDSNLPRAKTNVNF